MKKFLLPLLFIIVCNLYSQTWEHKFKAVFWSVSFPDDNIGWAVGYEGFAHTSIIYKTTDGGNDWIRQYGSKNGSELMSVHFIDTLTGWACGTNGMLLKTTDGGNNWLVQTSNTSYGLKQMYWLDQNNGWIVTGDGSSVLRTTNGGIDWTITWTGTGWWLRAIFFVDSNTGWVTGDGGTIRKTTDGGTTWNQQVSGTTIDNLSGICFIDSLTGWIVGGPYDTSCVILKTTDGGSNWVEQTSPINWYLESVQFLDANNGWAVGWGGTIIQTTDGGENWTPVPLTLWERSDLTYITFHKVSPNVYTGWICGYGLSIYKSEVSISVGINNGINSPKMFKLFQNYPNPFNPSTTIEYQVATQGDVEVSVYDINGRLVRNLVNEAQRPGSYTLQWNGRDAAGINVSSGTYFYQVKSEGTQLVKKMLLLK